MRAQRSADARGSGARRVARALFDGLEAALARTPLPPGVALGCASRLGAWRSRLAGRWPAANEMAALFATAPGDSRRLAGAVAAAEARTRLVVRRSGGRSLAPFRSRVDWRDPGAAAALRPPLVLATAHVGALNLLAAGFDRLALRRTVLRWSPVHAPAAGEEAVTTTGGLVSRTEALRRGLEALRGGGFVVTALDGEHGARERVVLFGRPFDLGVGAFALARLAGVPLVPVVALWRGTRVECELGPPLASAPEAAHWLEALLWRDPAQISLGLLRRLLLGPAVEATDEDARGR